MDLWDQFPDAQQDPWGQFPDAQEAPVGRLEAFTRGAKNAASLRFDDELRGFGRALGTAARKGELPSRELINRGIQEIRDEYSQAQEQRPGFTLAGEATAAILPAFLPGGQTIASRIGSGNLAARAGKGAVAAAIPSAAYGFGSGEGLEDRVQSAGSYGLGGAAIGAALPVAGALVSGASKGLTTAKTGLSARGGDALDETAARLKQSASNLYKKSRETGAVINTKRAANISTRIESAISATGKNNARLHGDTLSVLEDLKEASRSRPFSLEELDQYRQLFSEVINKNTDAIKGMNPDALKASKAIEALDDAVENLAGIDIVGGKTEAIDALKAGRAEWAKYRKFESVANIIKQANGDPNKIKSGFQRFVNKPKNLRGFTNEEIATLKAAANNTMNEKILKGLGRFGIESGNLFLPIVSGGLGGLTGFGGPSAIAIGAGTLARQGQKYVARGKAENVMKMLESRPTPRAEEAPKALSGTMDLQAETLRKKLKVPK